MSGFPGDRDTPTEARETLFDARRPRGQWPAWMDDLLRFGPLAELEPEWRAEVGDAVTKALDARQEAINRG